MRVVLVTGAAQGVGYSTAKMFAAMGYHVVLTDVQPLDAQIETLSALGHSVSAVSGDISSEAFVTELAEKVARDHTAVDVLVNNAGISMICPAENTSLDQWHRMTSNDL
jgi:NAD(P)-dependent dehydrogenase (short-subunit alcohol dehydrogenase family)